LVRELDERLGLGDLIAEHLADGRRGKNTQLLLGELFRQSVCNRTDRPLVADEFTAAAGEDRRLVDQAREVLLAAAGGKRSDAAAVRGHGVPDCRPTGGAVGGGL